MVDKHCDKHSRFHYNCEKCREAAKEYARRNENKRLYPDYEDSIEEKDLEILKPDDIEDRGEEKRKGRYKYVSTGESNLKINKRKIKKYAKILIPLLIIILTLVTLLYLWPNWYGPINLNSQLYANKAGGLDYNDYHFLRLWSPDFFFNKTCLTTAIVGCLIMSLPPNKNLITIIGTKLRFGKPSTGKALIFWWTVGFIIFYMFGFLVSYGSEFAWAMYLIETGELQLPITLVFDAYNVLFNPTALDVETIFLYSNIVLPLAYFIFGILIVRAFLNIASNLYLRRNDYNVASNALMIVTFLFGIFFVMLPTYALNGLELIQIFSILLFMICTMLLGIGIYLFGKRRVRKDMRNYKFARSDVRKLVISVVAMLIVGFFPLFYSIPSYINLNNTSTWNDLAWSKGYRRQITWTQACAGLDIFEERTIENYTSSKITSDENIISQVRQYDQNFAIPYLTVEIGTTYEGLADADIVYFEGNEYWVAPKTLKWSEIDGDPTKIHTELYDHVEGFLALDTYSKEIVNVTEVFNISDNYPIFFGEHERSSSSGAYDPDILLGTDWQGSPYNDYVYTGEPDGTLTGLEAFWFTSNMGLLTYASEPNQEYLINRNIKTRVREILLPGLKVDYDPYLVFNKPEGKMYYAVSIYTSIFIGSYSTTPVYRFLGVCLVDVLDGTMNFYKNPALIESSNDPTYNLWSGYISKYNWQTAPGWLHDQLRYPESLFELQLAAYYKYHVTNPTTWKREDDFQERPENGDLFYIETDLGDGIEYVGLDLVEYLGQEATRLAGLYVVRHGIDHFGEVIFYHTRDSAQNLIGPRIAREKYELVDTGNLTLAGDYRLGNTLLYPLGNSLYYYIPAYTTIDQEYLVRTGFVEAFTQTQDQVGRGSNIMEAYNELNIGKPGPFTLSTENSTDEDGDFYINWTSSSKAESYAVYYSNETITDINENVTQLDAGLTTNSYHVSNLGLENGSTYYFIVVASNEYNDTLSNCIDVTIMKPLPIYYEFSMGSLMVGNLTAFEFFIRNENDNSTAPPYQIVVNLTFSHTLSFNNFTLVDVPSRHLPLLNTTTSNSATFVLLNNVTLERFDIMGFGGNMYFTVPGLIIDYKYELFVDGFLYKTIIGSIQYPNI